MMVISGGVILGIIGLYLLCLLFMVFIISLGMIFDRMSKFMDRFDR